MNLLSQSALKLENRSYLIVSEKILNWNSCLVVLKNSRIFRISFFACHLNWIQFTLHILNIKTLPHFAKMILLYIEGSISIFESNQLVVHNEFELFFCFISFADQISLFCFTQNMAISCHIVEAFKYTIVGNRDTIHKKLNNLGRRSINFTHLTNTDANTLNIKQKTHFVIFKSLPNWWTNFRKKISNRNNYISL